LVCGLQPRLCRPPKNKAWPTQTAPCNGGKAEPLLPSIEILEVDKAPVVDGVLDDACWDKAKESKIFTDEYSFPVKLKTRFKICQKDETIYLAIRAC